MLPRALREYSGGKESVRLDAGSLEEALQSLDRLFPGVGERILDDQGKVRRFVHVFVNQDSVAQQEPGEVTLRDGDTIHILPSVAGGLDG